MALASAESAATAAADAVHLAAGIGSSAAAARPAATENEGLATIRWLVKVARAVQEDRVEAALELSAAHPSQPKLLGQTAAVASAIRVAAALRGIDRAAGAGAWEGAFDTLADLLADEENGQATGSDSDGHHDSEETAHRWQLPRLASALARSLAPLSARVWPTSAELATWADCAALEGQLRLVSVAAESLRRGEGCSVPESAATAAASLGEESPPPAVGKDVFSWAAAVLLPGPQSARAAAVRACPALRLVALHGALEDGEPDWAAELLTGLGLVPPGNQHAARALMQQLRAARLVGNRLRAGLDLHSAAEAARREFGEGTSFRAVVRRLAPLLDDLAAHASAGSQILAHKYDEAATAANRLGFASAELGLQRARSAQALSAALAAFAAAGAPERRAAWEGVLRAAAALEEAAGEALAGLGLLRTAPGGLSATALEALADVLRRGNLAAAARAALPGLTSDAQRDAVRLVVAAALVESDLAPAGAPHPPGNIPTPPGRPWQPTPPPAMPLAHRFASFPEAVGGNAGRASGGRGAAAGDEEGGEDVLLELALALSVETADSAAVRGRNARRAGRGLGGVVAAGDAEGGDDAMLELALALSLESTSPGARRHYQRDGRRLAGSFDSNGGGPTAGFGRGNGAPGDLRVADSSPDGMEDGSLSAAAAGPNRRAALRPSRSQDDQEEPRSEDDLEELQAAIAMSLNGVLRDRADAGSDLDSQEGDLEQAMRLSIAPSLAHGPSESAGGSFLGSNAFRPADDELDRAIAMSLDQGSPDNLEMLRPSQLLQQPRQSPRLAAGWGGGVRVQSSTESGMDSPGPSTGGCLRARVIPNDADEELNLAIALSLDDHYNGPGHPARAIPSSVDSRPAAGPPSRLGPETADEDSELSAAIATSLSASHYSTSDTDYQAMMDLAIRLSIAEAQGSSAV